MTERYHSDGEISVRWGLFSWSMCNKSDSFSRGVGPLSPLSREPSGDGNKPQVSTKKIGQPKCEGQGKGDFNGFGGRLFHLFLGNDDSKHPVLHSCLHLIHLRVLWKPESPQELAPAPLHLMPLVGLLFLLLALLSANLKDSSFLNLHLHLLFLHPWKIRLDNMGFWSLLPVDSNVCELRSLISRWRR
ncbi:Alpha crystallin/Hsp20 domain-containing protein [Cinnamomum micranthum f. kanehirae]|uniref:Alpha crystallin/Hsp20 domain-containing protein n=1 Tax=Cinnamomum micranthum f. kanehirae TaxID=337451 RepID=A0A3S3NK47_9MAGN|nr:Alpha crystallin/Hsp20 domain-containing protein [Cinnamomum micranthum f. kanehirae]